MNKLEIKLRNIRNAYYMKHNKCFERCVQINKYLSGAQGISFSQSQEDIIIERLTKNQRNGLYVDVGAHHPFIYSNTFGLHLKGWRGINIDPLPGCKELFDRYRKNCVNLCLGIASKAGNLTYYSFYDPAYNTLNENYANEIIESKKSQLKEKIDIPVETLEDVFDKYINNHQIDFLTIDVETMEYDVLQSNNWEKYRPKFIVIESLGDEWKDIYELADEPATKLLLDNGYKIVAKYGVDIWFMDKF